MNGTDELASVNTAMDEANAFIARHPEVRDHTFGSITAIAFGMLKAMYECFECPGVTMLPLGFDGIYDWAQCPNCQRQYGLNLRGLAPRKPTPIGTRRRRGKSGGK